MGAEAGLTGTSSPTPKRCCLLSGFCFLQTLLLRLTFMVFLYRKVVFTVPEWFLDLPPSRSVIFAG